MNLALSGSVVALLMLVLVQLKERRNLMGLGEARSLDHNVVELLLMGQVDNLVNQVRLLSTTYAAVLHPNHHLVALDQRCLVNQTLVNVELHHVVDNDGTVEVLLAMLGLENMLQQGCLPRSKEATEQGDRDQTIIPRCWGCLEEKVFLLSMSSILNTHRSVSTKTHVLLKCLC